MKILILFIALMAVYCLYQLLYKIPKEFKELERRKIRNEKVFKYRISLLCRISVDEFKNIASYEEMLDSNKPLEDSYWVSYKNN
jgi:hypothetical protein